MAVFKSKKFQLWALDAFLALLSLIGGIYFPDKLEFILAIFAILQPGFVMVINGHVQEEKAKLAAGVHISQKS